jgi:hypothetical protein
MDYTPKFDWGSSTAPNSAQNSALGAAKKTLGNLGKTSYSMPDYYGSQLKAPAQTDYYSTKKVNPLQQVDMPSYLSFQGNDFQSWEDAIRNAAQSDINAQMGRTQTNMQSVLGGGGLYGSSIQGDQMVNLGDAWARALGTSAADAKTQRMQMEQDALNAQNQWNLNRANLGMDQNKSIWQADAAEQARMDQYNQGGMNWAQQQAQSKIDFKNQKKAGQYNADIAASEWKRMLDDAIFNKTMALATGSMPGASAQLNYKATQDATESAENSSMWEGIGGILGGYLSTSAKENSLNPFDWF